MSRVTFENPEGAPPAQGLYSHAARVSAGDLIFVAGQLAVGADGAVVGKNDFEAQFQCVFDNLGNVIRDLGADWKDIAKFTTYLVHSQDLEQFMSLRADLFPRLYGGDVFPPNTLLMVDRLVKEEFLIEVEAVVAAPSA
tara:strand:- start:144 stop:560 length:417 start_codon:yes stop_codon:yes gene_type:complete